MPKKPENLNLNFSSSKIWIMLSPEVIRGRSGYNSWTTPVIKKVFQQYSPSSQLSNLAKARRFKSDDEEWNTDKIQKSKYFLIFILYETSTCHFLVVLFLHSNFGDCKNINLVFHSDWIFIDIKFSLIERAIKTISILCEVLFSKDFLGKPQDMMEF